MINMFKKTLCLATALSIFSTFVQASKVEVQVELQVGNRAGEMVLIVDSDSYQALSMDQEDLGFAIRLFDAKEGQERFETSPTYNKQPLGGTYIIGKQMTIGAGANMNGHSFQKQLGIKFISIKKIS